MFDSGNSNNYMNYFGDFLSRMFSKNPADSAMSYYNKIPDMLKGIFQPYTDAGINATQPFTAANPYSIATFMGNTSNLLNNPTGMLKNFGSDFTQSPGYNWKKNQAMEGANAAAAAGGMAGTPAHQQYSANIAGNLANQDYYDFINHVMDLYKTGYSGAGNMFDTGANLAGNMFNSSANAASNYASDLAAAMMNQGNMSYNSSMFGNSGIGGMIGDIGGLISDFL